MIADFYKDCEVFITGGSGVVGKAAIEKLLRSTEVKRIFILLRDKKGDKVDQRLEKIKEAKIFRVLKSQKPEALNKLVAIPGDAVFPNLGITPYYAKLMENVSIVFHCAATVRFNETLRVAMKLNVGGSWEALKFAETLKKLKIYVHVSTFFSNPYLEYVEAKMYPGPMNWKICLKMVENEEDDEMFDALYRKIIMGFPNTYCFTKNLAEQLVNDYCGCLPVVIFRPSIVISAILEPEPGFPPSLTGAMGLFALTGAGLLKTVHSRNDVLLDMTPLDYGTNIMLTTAYIAHRQYQECIKFDEVPVTMSSSNGYLRYSLEEIANTVYKLNMWNDLAFEKNFLIPNCYFFENKYLYNILNFTHQITPALLADGLLKLFGQKPILMGLVRKAYTSLEVMKPFLFNNYKSDIVEKSQAFIEVTNGTDFNMLAPLTVSKSEEDFNYFAYCLVAKIREVLLKEDPATLPRARKVLKIKIIIYNIVRLVLAYYLLRWFYRVFNDYFVRT